jgi:hypothetical protein
MHGASRRFDSIFSGIARLTWAPGIHRSLPQEAGCQALKILHIPSRATFSLPIVSNTLPGDMFRMQRWQPVNKPRARPTRLIRALACRRVDKPRNAHDTISFGKVLFPQLSSTRRRSAARRPHTIHDRHASHARRPLPASPPQFRPARAITWRAFLEVGAPPGIDRISRNAVRRSRSTV